MGLHCAGPPHMVVIQCFLCIWQDPYRKNVSEELLLHPPWKHGEENLTPQCLFAIPSPPMVTPCGFYLCWKLNTSLSLLSKQACPLFMVSVSRAAVEGLCIWKRWQKLREVSEIAHTQYLRCCETAEVFWLIWQTWHRRQMSARRGSWRPSTLLQDNSSGQFSEDAAHTGCLWMSRCLSSQCRQLKPSQCSQQHQKLHMEPNAGVQPSCLNTGINLLFKCSLMFQYSHGLADMIWSYWLFIVSQRSR